MRTGENVKTRIIFEQFVKKFECGFEVVFYSPIYFEIFLFSFHFLLFSP